MFVLLTGFVVVLALAGLAACGSEVHQRATSDRSPGAELQTPDAPWQKLLTSRDLDGNALGDVLGRDREPTIVVVFASWCRPCRAELSLLDILHHNDPKVHIVGVNAYETFEGMGSDDAMRTVVDARAPWMSVVRADAELLAALGGVPRVPSIFVFDGDGGLAASFRNIERPPPTLDELSTLVAELRDRDARSNATARYTP